MASLAETPPMVQQPLMPLETTRTFDVHSAGEVKLPFLDSPRTGNASLVLTTSTQESFLGRVSLSAVRHCHEYSGRGGIEDIDDHEDLIYTVVPDPEDYNTAACLLESD